MLGKPLFNLDSSRTRSGIVPKVAMVVLLLRIQMFHHIHKIYCASLQKSARMLLARPFGPHDYQASFGRLVQ